MHKQAKLWGLWLAPAIGGLVVVAAAYVAMARSPADARQELAIGLEELRSEVAEAGLLAEHGRRGDLTRLFVREHARQLERHIRASLDDVREKGTESGQRAVSERATTLGADALTSLRRLADDPASAPAMQDIATTMADAARELSRLDQALRQRAP
jgi:hypothetical protein